MIRDLVLRNRSYRRFHRDKTIELETLREIVDLARLSASAGNRQALKYIIVNDPQRNSLIFKNIGLAGNPTEEEAPTAYIIILGDKRISNSFGCDQGIAAQSILLGASENGIGGCMVGMINNKELIPTLNIPSHYEILLILILGIPKEEVVIETTFKEGTNMSWVDIEGVRHVPKRLLDDIIVRQDTL
ncbi:nitroreductase family protein [Chloroflexota bacterium]